MSNRPVEMGEMSPQVRGKILELFGVPKCECLRDPCAWCDGARYSFMEATRENWPWWHEDYARSEWDGTQIEVRGGPYLPSFPNDPSASLVLAQKILDRVTGCDYLAWDSRADGPWWEVRRRDWDAGTELFASGPTLGGALLAALEESTKNS